MSSSVQVFFLLIAILGYLVAPLTLIWGWLRWMTRPKLRTIPSLMSFIGFILASASALLALSALVYAALVHGFGFYDPRLMRIMAWGMLLSLAGFVFGICGIWRPNSLRWHSPISAICTLTFWFGVAESQ
jgi:hypothetical protein